jgi:hypothetical protein
MATRSCALLVLLCSTAAVFAEPPARTPADKAVDRALEYLQHSQAKDGAWRSGAGKSPALTGLAVMAFLSAGHVPGEGKYGATVEKGIRWVLAAQQPNGLISNDGSTPMYHHGICALMLAESAGMTDDKLGAEVRRGLVKAVGVILQAQRKQGPHAGGWRYQVRGVDGDISVTGWQVMALRAAKDLGCDVPVASIERAIEYIKHCHEPVTGGYYYQPHSTLTVACTGTSVLALEICGKEQHGTPDQLRAGAYILKNPPWHAKYTPYAIYYCTQALYQLGDNYWQTYRPRLHEYLLGSQRPNGCWDFDAIGPDYCTATAVLALTVDYGFLPIYQRGEEPAGKRAK